jgi:uncharacterized ubiquitin-like protein YukD
MEKVFELRISSYSDIREIIAMLAHEMKVANASGKELFCEIWKERHEELSTPERK